MEGHWLLDGIDAEGYEVVVGHRSSACSVSSCSTASAGRTGGGQGALDARRVPERSGAP